jgi:tRNA threonylcarbamoyladenosine biosynthesis protein TsaB
VSDNQRLLLIDTCGEVAAVALSRGNEMVRVEELAERSASGEIVAAVRRMLGAEGWALAELDGVGVVSGPGSFTGMRTGLAAAKGLCEAASLPLAAVSRLAVLAEAAEAGGGFAVLRAGRDELYVRDLSDGRERMCGTEEFRMIASDARVVVAETRVVEQMAEMNVKLHSLQIGDSLALVRGGLQDGGCDVASVDANYVRAGREIYRKQGDASKITASAE